MSELSWSVETYRTVKKEYPDALLFMRLGDFYEAFDEDAETAARELGVLLTSAPDGEGENAPMAGMPWKTADEYTARLVEKGYTVARLEPVRKHPKEADCPTCGATAGHWCKRPSGHSGPMVAFHAARCKAADAAEPIMQREPATGSELLR